MSDRHPTTHDQMTVAGDTAHPEREYRRAMRDFAHLNRHRLANQVTALAAGISALRELDGTLDRRVRAQMLDSLLNAASTLERSVVHPELAPGAREDLASGELDEAQLAELLVADIVHAEQHARTINERLFTKLAEGPEQPVEFLCECWALECDATVTMPMADYWIVHARHDQFVVAPRHDLASVEQVVERHRDWWVVRKTATTLRTALDERMRLLHDD